VKTGRVIYEVGYNEGWGHTTSFGIFSDLKLAIREIENHRKNHPRLKWMNKITNTKGFCIFRFPLNVFGGKEGPSDWDAMLLSPKDHFRNSPSQSRRKVSSQKDIENLLRMQEEISHKAVELL